MTHHELLRSRCVDYLDGVFRYVKHLGSYVCTTSDSSLTRDQTPNPVRPYANIHGQIRSTSSHPFLTDRLNESTQFHEYIISPALNRKYPVLAHSLYTRALPLYAGSISSRQIRCHSTRRSIIATPRTMVKTPAVNSAVASTHVSGQMYSVHSPTPIVISRLYEVQRTSNISLNELVKLINWFANKMLNDVLFYK